MLKFDKLYNNCYYLQIGKKIILISYESIIGVISNDILYLYDYYIGYSKTTSKHINLFRKNLIYSNEIIIKDDDVFNKIVNEY